MTYISEQRLVNRALVHRQPNFQVETLMVAKSYCLEVTSLALDGGGPCRVGQVGRRVNGGCQWARGPGPPMALGGGIFMTCGCALVLSESL